MECSRIVDDVAELWNVAEIVDYVAELWMM